MTTNNTHTINKRPKDDVSDDEDLKQADDYQRYELGYWKVFLSSSKSKCQIQIAVTLELDSRSSVAGADDDGVR